ncbi:MAG: hypothetical protein ACJ77K_04570 [Bacteroidia bacterium]
MNRELFDDYKKLSDTERSELNFRFKDSPLGLKLISFLDTCRNPNFKNTEAVGILYSEEKNATAYNVLENRYFKLRKKVHDELAGLSSSGQSGELLTAEQIILYRSKNVTSAGNKEAAFRELSDLEKECWKKNIFELLPDIIDQLVFFNQSFNRLDRNKALYERMEKAIELQYQANRVMQLSRMIYEINFTKGITAAKRELALLKDIAEKYSEYPRFLMCYHHVSLYYKLGSTDYRQYQQVVSRHLTAFKKLFARNPEVPLVSYKLNYTKNQHFHFSMITMFYHFNRCEFREAHQHMKEAYGLATEAGSVLKIYKTESLFFNYLTSQCMIEDYVSANETCNDYIAFLKENKQYEKLSFGYVQKASVISDAFPQTFKMDLDFLVEQLEDYLKKVRKQENVQASLEQTLALRFKLYFIQKKYKQAEMQLTDPLVKKYLEPLHVFDLYLALVELFSKNKPDKIHQLREILKQVQQRKYKAITPGEYMQMNWLIHHLNYLLKQTR